jgi:hypothetical protein
MLNIRRCRRPCVACKGCLQHPCSSLIANRSPITVTGSGTGPYLLLSGGTMTGALALAADPTTSPQAANKHYVDQSINLAGNYLGTWSVAANTPNISAGGAISNANYVAVTSNPATPEVVPVGVPGIAGLTVANGDRVIWASGLGTWQILRNAGVTLAAADARYVALGGSVMTGALTLPGNAASALQAVPLQQVPVASSTTPAMDGTATVGAGTTWAKADHIHPTDTSRYAASNPSGYQTAAQVSTAVAPALNNVGRNLVHNSMFNVAQRGAGPFNTNGVYTLDRWRLQTVSDTGLAVSQVALSDGARTGIGDEAAASCLQLGVTGNAATGAFTEIVQAIEGVRRLAGKTVTLSFYATSSAGQKLGINGYQSFGTGGSPSAAVIILATGNAITTTTAWVRYSVTFAVPSSSGKTLGTNGDDCTVLQVWFSSGATNNASAGNIGVQSGTFQLWGVQLEIGSVATPLEKLDPQVDLANCLRFYQTGAAGFFGYATAGAGMGYRHSLPVTMRAAPTLTQGGTPVNASLSFTSTVSQLNVFLTTTATGAASWQAAYTASADL